MINKLLAIVKKKQVASKIHTKSPGYLIAWAFCFDDLQGVRSNFVVSD